MMSPEQIKKMLEELGIPTETNLDFQPLTPMTEEERATFQATKSQAFCQHQYLFSAEKIICIKCGYEKGS